VLLASVEHVCAIRPPLRLTDRPVEGLFSGRVPGFGGLVQIILEQQVSVKAGLAMWAKLLAVCPAVEAEPFLALDDEMLRACGFSRQKMAYARGAADALVAGTLDLERLASEPEHIAMQELTALKGIGRWTAEIYLLSCLGRADVWPAGDLALVLGVQHLEAMPERPSLKEMDTFGENFAGHRSVAALLTWHYYRRNLRPNSF